MKIIDVTIKNSIYLQNRNKLINVKKHLQLSKEKGGGVIN